MAPLAVVGLCKATVWCGVIGQSAALVWSRHRRPRRRKLRPAWDCSPDTWLQSAWTVPSGPVVVASAATVAAGSLLLPPIPSTCVQIVGLPWCGVLCFHFTNHLAVRLRSVDTHLHHPFGWRWKYATLNLSWCAGNLLAGCLVLAGLTAPSVFFYDRFRYGGYDYLLTVPLGLYATMLLPTFNRPTPAGGPWIQIWLLWLVGAGGSVFPPPYPPWVRVVGLASLGASIWLQWENVVPRATTMAELDLLEATELAATGMPAECQPVTHWGTLQGEEVQSIAPLFTIPWSEGVSVLLTTDGRRYSLPAARICLNDRDVVTDLPPLPGRLDAVGRADLVFSAVDESTWHMVVWPFLRGTLGVLPVELARVIASFCATLTLKIECDTDARLVQF